MAITFTAVILVMTIITALKPLKKPNEMPVQENFDMRPAPSVVWLGRGVIVAKIGFYIIFW